MKLDSPSAVQALAALAQETRLTVFRLLVQTGPEGLVAGQIAEILGVPAPTLSFHMKTLAHGGLVRSYQEGRFVRYVADFEAMHGLIGYLSENCCAGNAAACAPRSIPTCEEKIA